MNHDIILVLESIVLVVFYVVWAWRPADGNCIHITRPRDRKATRVRVTRTR